MLGSPDFFRIPRYPNPSETMKTCRSSPIPALRRKVLPIAILAAATCVASAQLDFGDAGQLNGTWSFPMLLADDGPRHTITEGFHLGA